MAAAISVRPAHPLAMTRTHRALGATLPLQGRVSRGAVVAQLIHSSCGEVVRYWPLLWVGLGVGPSLFFLPDEGSGAPRRRMAWISPDRPDLTGGPGTPGPWRT